MKKILIIDDDKRIRQIIKIQLNKTKFTLFEAEDRPSALKILESEDIHVIICDIKMKDTNGFVLLEEMKKKYTNIPVIMLTGFIDKKVSDKAMRLGSFDFITKPVRRQHLIDTIRRALGEDG